MICFTWMIQMCTPWFTCLAFQLPALGDWRFKKTQMVPVHSNVIRRKSASQERIMQVGTNRCLGSEACVNSRSGGNNLEGLEQNSYSTPCPFHAPTSSRSVWKKSWYSLRAFFMVYLPWLSKELNWGTRKHSAQNWHIHSSTESTLATPFSVDIPT